MMILTEEVKKPAGQHFDLTLSNPPYGKIGDQITKTIIDTMEPGAFINLLPLKDYSLETANHIDFTTIKTLAPHSFSDADILTHAARISKTPLHNFKSKKELWAEAFTVDKPFIKFMKANALADHYAIDNIHSWHDTNNINTTFVFHGLCTNSQHTCGLFDFAKHTFANMYNTENIAVTTDTQGIKGHLTSNACRSICYHTTNEKVNLVRFCIKYRNFINRMIANQFIAIRDHSLCFPKVDWSKEWTPESILEYYNYTSDEIKAVMNTMDKDYSINKDSDIERLFGEYLV